MNQPLPLLLVLALGTVTLSAQSNPPPGPSTPPAEARQFDFWLGEWSVTTPDGQPAGESRIEQIPGGWGLLENWTGQGGGDGKSLNTWFPAKKQWQQFWVGAGGALELAGGLDGQGRMVLSGHKMNHQGQAVVDRITWTPNADGTVRQHWEQSTDEGKTWATVFDGLYRRKAR
jgi:hypothetical protein